MSENCQETRGKSMIYSYSHSLMVLPYSCQASENCLRQLSDIAERRLKRE